MAKKHAPKAKEWDGFKRNRHDPDHITRCKTGYRVPEFCQIHHLLCVHACSDTKIEPEKLDYIHECLAITKWNINDGRNTIGLPKKSAYVSRPDDSSLEPSEATDGWDRLPCHMVDHNPTHTTEVKLWVKTNIWDKLFSARKGERCEEVEQKKIHEMFEKGSDHFRKELTTRGEREGGTKEVIRSGYKSDRWYFPFSMAEQPTKRERPPQWTKLSLKGLLKKVK